VLTDHKAKEVVVEDGVKVVSVEQAGGEKRIAATRSSAPSGRAANTQGFGLEELGIPLTKQKTVEVNEYLQARYPNIFAVRRRCGPVPVHAHGIAHGVVLRR
jgi:pyruvate/2-oxoglutarate dehydrogenase complex dihydrolipoamide dehydrogenase (E3) component